MPPSNGRPQTKGEIESSPERPKVLAVEEADIPDVMRRQGQWVCWRYERRNEKWTKVPVDPKTGGAASSTDPATWAPFDRALAYYRRHDLAGIGFVFAAGERVAGVDLDDCRNPETAELAQWAEEIIRELDSYGEVSPSGTGVKVFVRGEVPAGGNRKGKVEMYDRGRYFAVTGHRLPDVPPWPRLRPKQLAALRERLFAQTDPASRPRPTEAHPRIHNHEGPE